MPDSSSILTVTIADVAKPRHHRCDGFHIDEHGNLVIAVDKKVVCVYAKGVWERVVRPGNQVEKGA